MHCAVVLSMDGCLGPGSYDTSHATFHSFGCITRTRASASRHDSRQEPYAVAPHVRICAGGGGRGAIPAPTATDRFARRHFVVIFLGRPFLDHNLASLTAAGHHECSEEMGQLRSSSAVGPFNVRPRSTEGVVLSSSALARFRCLVSRGGLLRGVWLDDRLVSKRPTRAVRTHSRLCRLGSGVLEPQGARNLGSSFGRGRCKLETGGRCINGRYMVRTRLCPVSFNRALLAMSCIELSAHLTPWSNPSIERTCQGPLRAPCPAAHVKR
jgi:hypothetical protein